VPRSKLACPNHWALVSEPTKREVYAAYRSGDLLRHIRAMGTAKHEMNAALGSRA
jgi:hypothetical protein